MIIIAKKKELSENPCQCFVRPHSEGKAYKAISKQYDVPVATVQSMINKHKRFNTGSVRCPPKLARKICPEVNNDPRSTTKALIETLDQAGTKVSWSIQEVSEDLAAQEETSGGSPGLS